MEQLDLLTAIAVEEGRSGPEPVNEASAEVPPAGAAATQLTELPGESFEEIFGLEHPDG